MTTTVSEIKTKVRELNADDKANLICSLIADLDGPPDTDVEAAWLEEAQRRHGEIVEGKVHPVSGERVFANLSARLKR